MRRVWVFFALIPLLAQGSDVYVRFQMITPPATSYWVKLGGYIHNEPWYLPTAVWPDGADRNPSNRVASGQFTPWLDYGALAGAKLHRNMNRAGGLAEFPDVTVEFLTGDTASKGRSATRAADVRHKIVIEVATEPGAVVKRFREEFTGSLTSFLLSPDPARDADRLETASEMTARRLRWAREIAGGRRVSPTNHILQTGFWAPQRPELNLQEAEVLWLLGFNTVGGMQPEVAAKYSFRAPHHTHHVNFRPSMTKEAIDALISKQVGKLPAPLPGTLFNFSDEVTSQTIGSEPAALAAFQSWLAAQGVAPADLGVRDIREVIPIEKPDQLKTRQATDRRAANRVFYYSSRFRQASFTERVRWHTDAIHARFSPLVRTSTLVADHPYFGGTGLGMGMTPDSAWGSHALAADWFDLARRKAVDLAGIEDWMGLQFMYGPKYTWEGFQLMGFQASIFRSGSGGTQPIIAWITPGDGTNTILKSASALCQGAKNFFYWTYGPTCTSTENYWSDSRGMYEGVSTVARQLAAAEHVTGTGVLRPTRLALLYSISSDLWQPFGYVHMLERRLTYLALVHEQLRVDMLTEEDVSAGRLKDYDVLYVTDPCIRDDSAAVITGWVKRGGVIYGSCGAGSFNEFNETTGNLNAVFGIGDSAEFKIQTGAWHIRGSLNKISYLAQVAALDGARLPGGLREFGALGVRAAVSPAEGAAVIGLFDDGRPAVISNSYGRGRSIYTATCPALAYGKEAHFVPDALREQWREDHRQFIANAAGIVARPVRLSTRVVEAGVYDTAEGAAVVLANFTYQPIAEVRMVLDLPRPPRAVRSAATGRKLKAVPADDGTPRDASRPHRVKVDVPLALMDIIVFDY